MSPVSVNDRTRQIENMAVLRHLRGLCRYELHDGLSTGLPAVCHEDQTVLETQLMHGVLLVILGIRIGYDLIWAFSFLGYIIRYDIP